MMKLYAFVAAAIAAAALTACGSKPVSPTSPSEVVAPIAAKSDEVVKPTEPVSGEVVTEPTPVPTTATPAPVVQLPAILPEASGSRMFPGQWLLPSRCLVSFGNRFCVQADGNLVLYTKDGAPVLVASAMGKKLKGLVLQPDGNLVLRDENDVPVWDAGTAGTFANELVMQNDGKVVLYATGKAVWSVGTSVPPVIGGTLDTSWRRLLGPLGEDFGVEFRWISVEPPFGSTVKIGTPPVWNCQVAPEYCFAFEAQVRVNIPNPENSVLLGQIVLIVTSGGTVFLDTSTIMNGQTVTIRDPGSSHFLNSDPSRIVIYANFGPETGASRAPNENPCPSREEIARWSRSTAPCTLRTEFPTGYIVGN